MPAEERLAFARKSAGAYAVEQTMLMDDVRADEP